MRLEEDLRDLTEFNNNVVTSDSVQQESTYLVSSDAQLLTENDNSDEKVDLMLSLIKCSIINVVHGYSIFGTI